MLCIALERPKTLVCLLGFSFARSLGSRTANGAQRGLCDADPRNNFARPWQAVCKRYDVISLAEDL